MCCVYSYLEKFVYVFTITLYLEVQFYPCFIDDKTKIQMIT